jgi:hypothetical protein
MLTVVVSLKLWSQELKGKRVVIFCDNQAVCIVINSGKAKSVFLQQCLREICFIAAVNEFQIRAEHLSSNNNRISDCLSRWDLDLMYRREFFDQVSHISPLVDVIVYEDLFKLHADW